jgi:hypothetical protein
MSNVDTHVFCTTLMLINNVVGNFYATIDTQAVRSQEKAVDFNTGSVRNNHIYLGPLSVPNLIAQRQSKEKSMLLDEDVSCLWLCDLMTWFYFSCTEDTLRGNRKKVIRVVMRCRSSVLKH